MKTHKLIIEQDYWPLEQKMVVIKATMSRFREEAKQKPDILFVSPSMYFEFHYQYGENFKQVLGFDVAVDKSLDRKDFVIGISSIEKLLSP